MKSAGYMTEAEMKRLMEAYTKEDAEMSAEDARKMEMLNDEVISFATEDVLATEHFMNRLVRSDRRAAERLLNRVHDAVERLRAAGDKVTRATFEKMRATEGAFLKAVEESGYRYEKRKIVGGKDEEEEEKKDGEKEEGVDKREARKYNDYTYTKDQYDSFGWVRANDVLNADQYRDFTRRFADVVARGYAVEKSLYGEYIIPVSGLSDEHFGIDNTIVFAKGTIERPIITRVVKIDLESETEIEQVREFIVEYEKQNGESIDVAQNYYGQEIVIQIRKRDELSYQEYSASKRRNGGRNSSQSDNGVDRSRTGGGRNHSESEKADVKQNIDEDSETIRRSKKPSGNETSKLAMEDRIVEQKPRPMDFDERVMDETRREAEAREGGQVKQNRNVQHTAKTAKKAKVSDLAGVAYSLGEAERAVDRCVKLLKEMTDEPASALAVGERVVKPYIQSLKMKKTEKEALYRMAGCA